MIDPTSVDRAGQYLSLIGEGVKLKEYLGSGMDGDVWKTSNDTAIKIFKYDFGYRNERDCYQRLAEWGVVEQIDGFWIPKMLGYDDGLMVVEMDLMQHTPYIIDFAKIKIDRPPDFSPEVLREFDGQGREQFEHNWPAVQSLMSALESYQIYYLDPKRGNITFPDMP